MVLYSKNGNGDRSQKWERRSLVFHRTWGKCTKIMEVIEEPPFCKSSSCDNVCKIRPNTHSVTAASSNDRVSSTELC